MRETRRIWDGERELVRIAMDVEEEVWGAVLASVAGNQGAAKAHLELAKERLDDLVASVGSRGVP